MPPRPANALSVAESQRSVAQPVQTPASEADLNPLFSGLDPLYPEGDWFDDQHQDANTAQDPPASPSSASKNQSSLLPAAFVEHWLKLSLSLSHQDVPSNIDSPLPSYLAKLPEGAVYSAVRVLVSWPEQQRLSASSQNDSRELVWSKSVNVKIYLENTVQLISMGLTGNQESQEKQLHQIRIAQAPLDDEPVSSLKNLDVNYTEESEEHWLGKTLKSRAAHENPTDKTGPAHSIHDSTSTPFSRQGYFVDHEHPEETRSPLSSTDMQDAHFSSAFEDHKLSSKNVQLYFDHDSPSREFHLTFRPSLLLNRFQVWTEHMEKHDAYGSRSFLAVHDDPSALNDLGEFLTSNGLDPDAFQHLCSRHRPRSLSCSVNEHNNSIPQENTPGTELPQGGLLGKRDDCDLLKEYCILDEYNRESISQPEQEQGTAMRLPRVLSWYVSSLQEDPAEATAWESQACCPRPSRGPDFLLEETAQDCEASCRQATIHGTLKDIWTRLTKQQQHHLMLTLVKMLVDIWNNFDILNQSEPKDPPAPSKHTHPDDPLEPHLQPCGVQRHTSSQQQLPPACINSKPPFQDHGHSFSPRHQEGLVERTPVKVSAAESLDYLEEEFLNRSFLDAFKHATASSPPGNHSSLTSIASLSGSIRPSVPQESSSPEKRRRIDTEKDEYSHESASQGRITCQESMSRSLNSMGCSQRMTATRAEVLETIASQKSGSKITPIDRAKSPGTGMRRFDFSMDDLLIAATNEADPQDGCGQLYPSMSSKCEIVGVSRWKASGGTRAVGYQTQECSPRGFNVYQVRARESAYPLVHLFSLPDIFCPVELGGQCLVTDLDSGGTAGEFVRLLGSHSLAAAEFMTDTFPDKERALYHRWMAAWHERSPLAPKASKVRFELMRMVSNNRLPRVGNEEKSNSVHTIDNNEDDNSNSNNSNKEVRVAAAELKTMAPQAYKPICLIQQRHGHDQQPSGGEVSSPVAANLKARCIRCVEEEHEREMISEDKAWFDSTKQVLDKAQAQEKCRRQQQEIRQRSATKRDQALDQLARHLGLGKQWTKQSRALGFRPDALGIVSIDGVVASAETETEAIDDANDSLERQSQRTWILSAEEREVMRSHLFGPGNQAAIPSADAETGIGTSGWAVVSDP
ncbi:hypothetical protein EC968_000932 [Mortierella alpina]|nr:hypothetical protein EC968_000932 [Mortierella alpina]